MSLSSPLIKEMNLLRQEGEKITPPVTLVSAKVVLHPPYNITFFLITSTDAVIGWSPPDVYTMHDVNTTLIDPPFNTTMEWLGKTYPQPDSSSADVKPATAPEDSTMTVETATSETVNKSQVATKTHEELCQSLEYFANYTVDVNLTKEALEDYLPHLITMKEVFRPRNITADMLHKPIVPFAQGCVKEYRVYYQAEQSGRSCCVYFCLVFILMLMMKAELVIIMLMKVKTIYW